MCCEQKCKKERKKQHIFAEYQNHCHDVPEQKCYTVHEDVCSTVQVSLLILHIIYVGTCCNLSWSNLDKMMLHYQRGLGLFSGSNDNATLKENRKDK